MSSMADGSVFLPYNPERIQESRRGYTHTIYCTYTSDCAQCSMGTFFCQFKESLTEAFLTFSTDSTK